MAMPKPSVKISWTANTPKKILSMRESRMQVPSVRASRADRLQERWPPSTGPPRTMLRSYVKGRFEVKELGPRPVEVVMDESVGYLLEDGIAVVTMRRPHRLTALDGELLAGLVDALARARTEGARALVLTGAQGSFCAGADLRV